MEEILIELAGILVLGMVAQWLGWRFRVPSILLLLIFGFVAKPMTGVLDPNHLLGDLLIPIVSVSVGIILFEVNSLANLKYTEIFGSEEVYQLAPQRSKNATQEASVPQPLRGKTLFGKTITSAYIEERFNHGAVIKATPITSELTYQDYQKQYGKEAIPFFIVNENNLKVITDQDDVAPQAGETLISLVDPVS